MPDYIFLSYSSADRSYVDFLARRLVAEGIPYWIDRETDDDGGWAAALDDHLAGAAAVVVVVSPGAVTSPRVDRTVRHGHELGKPILPLIRRRAVATLLAGLEPEDVTTGGMPSAAFYERLRAYTGTPVPSDLPDTWKPQTRLPHRLGPIARTPAETWGVRALLAAAALLALAGLFGSTWFGGNWNVFLVFPAFGIPDGLFAWFRWRRFRLPGRWSTDVRASVLLTGLTLYLTFAAGVKLSGSTSPFVLFGIPAAIVLGFAAAAVWIAQVVRDRPR
jgi:hypothetical protein